VIPIYWASGRGHAKAVKALIDGGAAVNYRNPNIATHQSNLMFAILYEQIDVVEVLLDAGANPDIGWDGETPLAFLKRRSVIMSRSPIQRAGDEKMMRLLEAKGAE
jgi:ankyrin repeat protein